MAEIREHEEFTKVKNIERIELGRYDMETWYFSPFPEEFKDCKVRAATTRFRECCALDAAHVACVVSGALRFSVREDTYAAVAKRCK